MRIYTPDGLAYPITVTKLYRDAGDSVEQNARLFSYEYKSWVTEGKPGTIEDKEGRKVQRSFYSDFESEFEGELVSLDVRKDQVINGRTAIGEIEETCRHEVQYGGMCANCGRDMTLTTSYNVTEKNTERAMINTVHSNTNLLVSLAEASRADEEAKRRLMDSRKLILVVDLDQTIIHATVDPTVAEWMGDPENPNYEALKDVRRFQLMEHNKADWYYIKLRPGTEQFLQAVSQYYELHIYTMGTRAYADNIAKIIDPDRKIFANRVLSRDENGTVIQKNLKRLFPVDSKMVVIIDDRGDVWSWIPNLVKVNPFDFFVGIGDINSSFLPKRPGIDKEDKPKLLKDEPATDTSKGNGDTPKEIHKPASNAGMPPSTNGNSSAVEHLVSMAGDQSEEAVKEKTKEQDDEIAAQLADRPLLQKQKMLEAAEEEAKTSPAAEAAVELLADGEKKELDQPRYRQNLLQDDDNELKFLEQHLIDVHHTFFGAFEKRLLDAQGGRVAELRPSHGKKRTLDDLQNIPDAASVMPQMKRQVLRGVHIVFSGVVPLGVDIQSYDTALWAKSFGATVSENITNRTTHVVASPERRTAKVKHAIRKGGRIAIVSTHWLFSCFREWRKVSEEPFRIFSDSLAANGERDGLPEMLKEQSQVLSSSDEDAALTEDETDSGIMTPALLNGESNGTRGRLELDTRELEDLEKHKPSDAELRDDSSPTETENKEDWAEINDELAEFMGSDVDDLSESNDSDNESTTSSKSRTPRGGRKRKRVEMELADDGEGDGEEDNESRLQKRKKEAMARTTSLTNMQNVPSSKGSTPAAAEEAVDPGGDDGNGEHVGEENEDDDGDLEAMLAAEMERQSDEAED